jgi:hypothetical protein
LWDWLESFRATQPVQARELILEAFEAPQNFHARDALLVRFANNFPILGMMPHPQMQPRPEMQPRHLPLALDIVPVVAGPPAGPPHPPPHDDHQHDDNSDEIKVKVCRGFGYVKLVLLSLLLFRLLVLFLP